MKNYLNSTILRPLAKGFSSIGARLAHYSSDPSHGIFVVHCMDARINIRPEIKSHFNVPNAFSPAGVIVTEGDLSVQKRFEVARDKFAMTDILIMGHQHCAAMSQLTETLLGIRNDAYYNNFLVSGQGFPKVDLLGLVDEKKLIAPNIPDNLAVLTALHSARNVMNYNVSDGKQTLPLSTLITTGLVRLHVGYTALEQSRSSRWTERHHLLSADGRNLEHAPNLARAIIAQRENSPNPNRFEVAAASFASRLLANQRPTEILLS